MPYQKTSMQTSVHSQIIPRPEQSAFLRIAGSVLVFISVATLSAAAQSVGARTVPGSSFASSRATVALLAMVPPKLSLSISSVPLEILVTDPTQKSPLVTVPITSSWNLGSSANGVELIGFFESPAVAMTDSGGHAVASSRVLGGINQTKMGAFSEDTKVGTPGAGRSIFKQSLSPYNRNSSRSDVLYVQVDQIADLGLPSGNYQGLLHLRLTAY